MLIHLDLVLHYFHQHFVILLWTSLFLVKVNEVMSLHITVPEYLK